MTTLCIIRHGITDWNLEGRFQGIEDIELNEVGKQQALDCTNYLKNFKWDAIVSSPLSRTKETARIIGNQIGINNIDIIDELIERDFGSAAGLLPQEREKKFPDGIIKDAETKEHTRLRGMEALKIIDNKYFNKSVIVITHGGIIRAILDALEYPDFFPKVIIKNAGITILKGHDYSWNVELFNYSM